MAELKRVLITLPDNLLKEMDDLVEFEKASRSRLIREAVSLYIQQKKQKELREKMISGYMKMAKINLLLSEECLEAENEDAYRYEQNLRSVNEIAN